MTHFVGLVVATDEDDLEQLLAPYDEQKPVVPYFKEVSDENKGDSDWNEFKSMSEHYKTDDLQKLLEHMPDWNDCPGEIKDGKLGYYSTYNKDSKWDWYVVGGRWEGIVPENQCLAEEVTKYFTEYSPSVVIDNKGWHTSKDWGWWGTYKPVEGQVDVVKQKLEEHKGKNVFIVDFHI